MLFRGFGVSTDLPFGYSLVQATILVTVISFCWKKTFWIIFTIPIFLISILYNARFGFVVVPIFLISLFLLLLFRLISFLFVKRVFAVVLAGVAVTFVIIPWSGGMTHFDEQLNWVQRGYEAELFGDHRGSSTGRFLLEMAVLPEDWNPFVGNGIILSNSWDPVLQSDVGYTSQLYFGGIFYFASWCAFFLILFRLGYLHARSSAERVVILTAGFFLVVANFKGDAIHSQTFLKIILLIVIARIPIQFISSRTTENYITPKITGVNISTKVA